MLVGIPVISCETNQNGKNESHPDYESNVSGNVIHEKYGLITDPTAILEINLKFLMKTLIVMKFLLMAPSIKFSRENLSQ